MTSKEILEKAGFIIDEEELRRDSDDNGDDGLDDDVISYSDRNDYLADPDPEKFTIEELERTLSKLIDNEDYEEAERISEILKRKKKLRDGGE